MAINVMWYGYVVYVITNLPETAGFAPTIHRCRHIYIYIYINMYLKDFYYMTVRIYVIQKFDTNSSDILVS